MRNIIQTRNNSSCMVNKYDYREHIKFPNNMVEKIKPDMFGAGYEDDEDGIVGLNKAVNNMAIEGGGLSLAGDYNPKGRGLNLSGQGLNLSGHGLGSMKSNISNFIDHRNKIGKPLTQSVPAQLLRKKMLALSKKNKQFQKITKNIKIQDLDMEGGFFPAIIAALGGIGSAIAAIVSASTPAVVAAVSGISASSIATAVASSAASAAAGAIASKVLDGKKGSGIKSMLGKAIKRVKLQIHDLDASAKSKFILAFNRLKKDPSNENLKIQAKKMFKVISRTMIKKGIEKVQKELGMKGSGIINKANLCKLCVNQLGSGAFDQFFKNMIKQAIVKKVKYKHR